MRETQDLIKELTGETGLEKPSYYCVIIHSTEKRCYGNTEEKKIATTETSGRFSNLKHTFGISHVVRNTLGTFHL